MDGSDFVNPNTQGDPPPDSKEDLEAHPWNIPRHNVPRRSRLDQMRPAERAIRDAMLEVEALAADVRLTDAVILLGQAQALVADFIDKVDPRPKELKWGIYRKVTGHTGVGMLYQMLMMTRNHTTGIESVIYIPLRVDLEWAGTMRPCDLLRSEFEKKFVFVGERLPTPAV